MKVEPPTGDEFDQMIVRISQYVLQNAETHPDRTTNVLRAAQVPKRRFGLAALVVTLLVVLGVGTAGGAIALGFGANLWPVPAPMVTTNETPTVPPTPAPTSTPTPTAAISAVPLVTTSNAIFTAANWDTGVTANVSGLTANTEYAVSIDSRYKGESKTPDGYFSILSTPIGFMADASGQATVTWTPDVFPQNYTDSGESGFLLGAYVRVDPGGGPVSDSSDRGRADPIALSDPLKIQFLPFDEITVKGQACIEPDQLVGDGHGLTVTLTGLVPHEFVVLSSHQTGGPMSYSFQGRGYADDSGNAVVTAHGNTSEYPVSSSASIAPGAWQLYWDGNYRVTPSPIESGAFIPIQVGDCG